MSFTGRRNLSLHGLRALESLEHFSSRNFSRRAAALAFAALAYNVSGSWPIVKGKWNVWRVFLRGGLFRHLAWLHLQRLHPEPRRYEVSVFLHCGPFAGRETLQQMQSPSNRRLRAQFEDRTISWRKRPIASPPPPSSLPRRWRESGDFPGIWQSEIWVARSLFSHQPSLTLGHIA